jgi:hypothetical protein
MLGNVAVARARRHSNPLLPQRTSTVTKWYENLYLAASVAYGSWILLGTLFYQ